MDSQAKLQRALEERRIRPVGEAREIATDVRIVAATNRDLWPEVQEGRFREDLYFRLQVFPLRLPSLRERREDVAELARHLLTRIGTGPSRLSEDALNALRAYEWPGNVREMLNVLRRASLFSSGDEMTGELVRRMIAASVFGAHPGRSLTSVSTPGGLAAAPELGGDEQPMTLADLERTHIEKTLTRVEGNITKAAVMLGIDRRTLQRKLRAWGIAANDE